MTVLELKILLTTLPDDMEVVTPRRSDYDLVEYGMVVEAVKMPEWYMRAHNSMDEKFKSRLQKCFLIGY